MIQFILNDHPMTLDDIAPSLTVLQFLRLTMVQTGTKEGCASGDCGACTVVVGECVNEAMIYKAINACITPMATLHGKQLITVEYLASGERLHPVQQAMVDCHGSQCGFCTPGFVMSLYAWWRAVKSGVIDADRHSIDIALSGNLCRCTGYQPILRAAQQALADQESDAVDRQQAEVMAQLQAIHAQPAGFVRALNTHFFIPNDCTALVQCLKDYPTAQLVAGATDLGLEITQALKTPTVLIYTGNVTDMKVITETDTTVRIGAAVTFSEMTPLVQRHFPAFGQLLDRFASLQIRNVGTLGGNIANASPIGDAAPVLIALQARLKLTGLTGTRWVPIQEFFTGYRTTVLQPDEVIECFEWPKLTDAQELKVYKLSKRFDDDISAVCMALRIERDDQVVRDVHLGFGGMAATPAGAINTERFLHGKIFNEDTVLKAGEKLREDFSPLSDVRASAEYRVAMAGNLLLRACLELNGSSELALSLGVEDAAHRGGFYRA